MCHSRNLISNAHVRTVVVIHPRSCNKVCSCFYAKEIYKLIMTSFEAGIITDKAD